MGMISHDLILKKENKNISEPNKDIFRNIKNIKEKIEVNK